MNYIIVTKTELDHYFYSTQRNNEIFSFWKGIVKKMPQNLLTELQTKRTDLVHVSEGTFELKGFKPYVFKTESPKPELILFLSKFVVYVKDTNDSVYKLKSDMQKRLSNKSIKGRKEKNSKNEFT